MMRNIPPTDMNGIIPTSAPIYEEDENIEFITVTEEMEAFLILDKYFPGGDSGISLSRAKHSSLRSSRNIKKTRATPKLDVPQTPKD